MRKLLWVIFSHHFVRYASIHGHFVVIVTIEVVCRTIFVVHIAYAIIGQVGHHHSYRRRHYLEVRTIVAEVVAIIVIIVSVVEYDCFISVGQCQQRQAKGCCNDLVHTIYKGMEATVVEVIYHTSYCVVRCTRGRRCAPMVVVRASVAVRRWHYMIAMRRMRIGVISMRRRCVMIVLGMRLAMVMVVMTIMSVMMFRRVVIAIVVTIVMVIAMTVMMTIATTSLATLLIVTSRMRSFGR